MHAGNKVMQALHIAFADLVYQIIRAYDAHAAMLSDCLQLLQHDSAFARTLQRILFVRSIPF